MAISIVLADENAIVRGGLQALFDSEPDFAVAGVASDGHEAVRRAERLKPDVLIIDLMMPGFAWLAALRHLRERGPQIRTVIFSMDHSRALVAEALENGAAGYVHKSGPEENLVRAVKEAGEGRRFLSPPRTEIAVPEYAEKPKRVFDPHVTLTRRQREILRLTAEGKTSTQSAAALKIGPRTVENHRGMERLALSNRTDLVLHAIRHGLISLDHNRR